MSPSPDHGNLDQRIDEAFQVRDTEEATPRLEMLIMSVGALASNEDQALLENPAYTRGSVIVRMGKADSQDTTTYELQRNTSPTTTTTSVLRMHRLLDGVVKHESFTYDHDAGNEATAVTHKPDFGQPALSDLMAAARMAHYINEMHGFIEMPVGHPDAPTVELSFI